MTKQQIDVIDKNVIVKDTIGDFALVAIPQEQRKTGVNAMLVAAGWIIAMSSLYIGGTLGSSLPFDKAVLAAVIGMLILSIIGGLMAVLGVKYGVSTAILARQCFGRFGSAIFGLVLVLALGIGWYAWQCAFFGMTIKAMFSESEIWLFNPKIATLWGGILMMLTAYYGYKGLAYLSYFAIPMICILCLFGVTLAIETTGSFQSLINVEPTGNEISFIQAIIIVVGGAIVGAICLPDISRYVKGNSVKGALLTVTGYFFGGLFCIIAGAAMSIAANVPGVGNMADIPAVMKTLGLGWGALLVLITAQWTTNDNNLYTGSLGMVNIFSISKKISVVIMATIGIIIAEIGIQNYFVPFLLFMGNFIPPLAGVIMADHWIVRGVLMRETYQFGPKVEYCKLNIAALGSTILAGYIGTYVIKVMYASLLSIVIAAVLYILIVIVFRALKINYTIGKWTEEMM